eukprot:jgi/Tetstr1/458030/TSEL_044539.t2
MRIADDPVSPDQTTNWRCAAPVELEYYTHRRRTPCGSTSPHCTQCVQGHKVMQMGSSWMLSDKVSTTQFCPYAKPESVPATISPCEAGSCVLV